MQKPELLAPVGSKEALIAAIDNGADAVYFGGTLFSARQFAFNFTNEELEWAIDYAHMRGVMAYVTVNTLIKETELEKAFEYLRFICNAGADAVIVQDIGILRLIREQLPALPVHASTQMNIHNAQGVKFLEEMGVKRIVLAREMSLLEIRSIKSQTTVEIETFMHGALCFCYSGQCLLSSMIGGRSGNRGYCAQPCRKKYRINKEEGYLLSPKDLNMSEHLGDLIESGIDSFKIEGRMKRPEYVAGVVRVYRKLIDRYLAAPLDFGVTKKEKHTLLQLFNREFTTGYFFGDPGEELMSSKYPHNRGTELGRTIDYDSTTKLVEIQLNAPLRVGDGIGVGNRETGITVRNIYLGKKIVKEATSGSFVKIPIDIEVADHEAIFKTYDSKLMESLEIGNIRKIPLKMSFKAKVGESLGLLIEDGENKVSASAGIVNLAKTTPVSKSSIAEQLIKLGGTIFEAKEVDFELDKNIFIPVSELNLIRRQAIEELEKVRIRKWKRECSEPKISVGQREFESRPILAVNISSIGSLKAAVDSGADVVYLGEEAAEDIRSKKNKPQITAPRVTPLEGVSTSTVTPVDCVHTYASALAYVDERPQGAQPLTYAPQGIRVRGVENPQGFGVDKRRFIDLADYVPTIKYAHEKGVKVFISIPRIVKYLNEIFASQSQQDLFDDVDGFLVGNIGVLYHIKTNFPNKPIILDYPLNVFNKLSIDFLMGFSERVTLSPELTLKEIEELAMHDPVECIIHGFFPLMVSEHDLVGGLFSDKRPEEIFLKDEKGYEFPVKSDMHNRTYIMNSRELCMLDYVPDILKAGVSCLRIEARTYDPKMTGKITSDYREAIDDAVSGKKSEKHCSGAYTNGHYFRGVS
jgi:putative protease